MKTLFILVRLPFFLLIAGLLTIFVVCVSLPGMIGLGLFVVPIAWLVFVVPLKLIGAAIENDVDGFKEYLIKTPAEYIAAFPAVLREGRDAYRSLYRWLMGMCEGASK